MSTTLPAAAINAVATAIAAADGVRAASVEAVALGRGSVGTHWRFAVGGRRYFVKAAALVDAAAFAAEADGLQALAGCAALVVPRVVAQGVADDDTAFLALDWLALDAQGDDAVLGDALVQLHALRFDAHGWRRDNFIGATPQHNARCADWPTFFLQRRLAPMLARAAAHGAPTLAEQAAFLFDGVPPGLQHTPAPALLHGDLWRGNVGFVGGRAALFDPAAHAGDAECDLAMAALFGGFSPRFFAAYAARVPPLPGAAWRRALYQLYHVLNHYVLFGGGYAAQATALLARLRQRDVG